MNLKLSLLNLDQSHSHQTHQKVYKISLIPNQPPLLLKYRFPKTYRHPSLDTQLTRQRLTFEARALVRAAKSGICVPGLRAVDLRAGWLMIEWIEGWSVREILDEDNHLISTLDLNLGTQSSSSLPSLPHLNLILRNVCRSHPRQHRIRISQDAYVRSHTRRSDYFQYAHQTR